MRSEKQDIPHSEFHTPNSDAERETGIEPATFSVGS